ncbi:shikimate dehydrogenase [Caminicella sporogenes DSM 14501]|uniref:Shikimate dehydrogenase (NADP(+)) n=1 Tax=Caminicella sporogenes DSM 14501 TaxID=1121266 RepID=A0A1M6SLX9_9FIRM|nr:shikimate dehydrogenase [Caminicella sporogenes]RKD26536.1 shikimate dehydrogenase [Caminicella sporogenes]SHK45619.1 shikimate dehydrogenase [Caminicella sporogenes DSM 14501]
MSQLYGLIGEKLSHSLSPAIHFQVFNELKLDGHYHLFEVKRKDLKDAVLGLKALGVKGVNVTIPYKIEIMKYLDEISYEAEKIGAVNTIYFKDNMIIGYNTDYYGFGMMLDINAIDVKNKKAVILGSGGAAKAVVQYLVDKGIGDIIIVSRHINRAKEKFKNYEVISYDKIKFLKFRDLIINCTPCGMYPDIHNLPIDKECISKFDIAIDLIYNPRETLFLKYSKERGLKSINGLYMLVGQAVRAEEIWNEMKIDRAVTDKIYQIIDSKI